MPLRSTGALYRCGQIKKIKKGMERGQYCHQTKRPRQLGQDYSVEFSIHHTFHLSSIKVSETILSPLGVKGGGVRTDGREAVSVCKGLVFTKQRS